MPDLLTVWRARREDTAEIARIQVDTWRTAHRGIVPDAFLDHLGDDLPRRVERLGERASAGDPAVLLVAELTRGILGFAAGGPDRLDRTLWEIYALYVAARAQRLGAGRRLVQASAEAFVHQAPARPLRIWTLSENPARAFYERLGGVAREVRTVEIGGRILEEAAYLWPRAEDLLVLP